MSATSTLFTFYLIILTLLQTITAFQIPNRQRNKCLTTTIPYSSIGGRFDRDRIGTLLDEFRTTRGEVVDPYETLLVSRKADQLEIKRSYRKLVKVYHPDMVKQSSNLPDQCNTLEDVMNQWERIRLSYEILYDNKRRRRYNRHIALVDPSDLLLNFVSWSVTGIGKGLFKASEMAATKVSSDIKTATRELKKVKNVSEIAVARASDNFQTAAREFEKQSELAVARASVDVKIAARELEKKSEVAVARMSDEVKTAARELSKHSHALENVSELALVAIKELGRNSHWLILPQVHVQERHKHETNLVNEVVKFPYAVHDSTLLQATNDEQLNTKTMTLAETMIVKPKVVKLNPTHSYLMSKESSMTMEEESLKLNPAQSYLTTLDYNDI
eukprot:CAMPEP_0172487840 /NCGR_PEP_ID=MMETSP1066-20121228/17086_1 /TAXON_ID=671091 /ORGANISM="Coscinodiscus wailesii, Strain CCMP2513" /LENGTH=387 /DNA_ID=CAMNT_0013254695 /DNA_START=145 /DNA_END=1308 /DNA_ORIENTATION=+